MGYEEITQNEPDEELIEQQKVYVDDLKSVMRTRSGRAVIHRHLESVGVFVDTFQPDPYIHARQSGLRAGGLMLLHEIMTLTPDEYRTMLMEHN